jgi:hypothetical protein
MKDREQRLTAESDDSDTGARPRANTAKPAPKPRAKSGPKPGQTRRNLHAQRDDVLDDRPPEERDADEFMEDLTDEERAAIFFNSSTQSALPGLPEIPGFHTCWLTTQHQNDTIAKRLRLGYKLIRASELGPEWNSMGVNSGEHSGCVMVNEMIAAKLPKRLFNYLMQQAHHYEPLREEEKIKNTIAQRRDELEERGSGIIEGDAMADLAVRRPAPTFVR